MKIYMAFIIAKKRKEGERCRADKKSNPLSYLLRLALQVIVRNDREGTLSDNTL